jgi:hypothetical protein
LLATIPYKTFPKIALGPLELRTFGVMVGLGVLIGAWVAARYIEQHTGVVRDETYRLATRLVVCGVIGARITWDLSHTNQINSPLDVIAVWKGGLQFSGGFIAAVLIGYPTFRKWTRSVRWSNLDGYAYGLTIGLAFGRIGCTSVGEHFGWQSNFPLAVDFRGGTTRDSLVGHPPPALAGDRHGHLLSVLRHRPVLVGLPAGQRQDDLARTDRCSVLDDPRVPGGDLDHDECAQGDLGRRVHRRRPGGARTQ